MMKTNACCDDPSCLLCHGSGIFGPAELKELATTVRQMSYAENLNNCRETIRALADCVLLELLDS